jgi:hypothetical protein
VSPASGTDTEVALAGISTHPASNPKLFPRPPSIRVPGRGAVGGGDTLNVALPLILSPETKTEGKGELVAVHTVFDIATGFGLLGLSCQTSWLLMYWSFVMESVGGVAGLYGFGQYWRLEVAVTNTVMLKSAPGWKINRYRVVR